MPGWVDPAVFDFMLVVGVLLVAGTVLGIALAAGARTDAARATISNLNARTRAWWVMSAIVFGAVLAGSTAVIVLFGLLSFLALREFITLTPTKTADHATLLWSFFLITPLQYVLVATHWYGLFSILIPVYAFLLIPTRSALAGDSERFLERTAKTQWGLMICTYCLSHAPALLTLEVPGFEGRSVLLLLFLLAVVELSDVFQYVWGKLIGRHRIAPRLSPNKTWEGFIGGAASATIAGALLAPMTPFTHVVAAIFAAVITLAGFAGGLVMSAIKRDRGVKDYGTLIEGHGGVLDRLDSLCFAAPLFFHLVRYFY